MKIDNISGKILIKGIILAFAKSNISFLPAILSTTHFKYINITNKRLFDRLLMVLIKTDFVEFIIKHR